MAIYFGNKNIKEIYVGSVKIKEVYYGSEKVWGGVKGYWIHKDTGVKTEFGLDDPSIVNGIMSSPSWATNASEVQIPSGVKELGNYCFQTCTSLISVTLPESVVSLRIGCFQNCSFLTSINIPKSVTSIGNECFNSCTSLPSITLPEGITSLGNSCFTNCISLTSITIPESVTSIGQFCFAYCEALTIATVFPMTPPSLGWYAFEDVHSSLNIKVPSASVDDYKTAPGWSDYADKISAIPIIDSYWIDKNNNTYYFDSSNTPIENFYGWQNSNKIINGETVNKDNIKEIYFGDSYVNVTSIGDYFLHSFTKTSVINLSGLSNVTSVGNYFLENARSITNMDLSVFNLNSIGTNFMSNPRLLTSINLSGLSNVTNIGNYFLNWSNNLTSIDLSPLSNVTIIGNMFLYQCYKLESIDLSPLSKVTSVGNYFLGSCVELTNIDFSPLSNVTNIGFGFLQNTYLSDVDLSSLSNLTNIGYNFLTSCENLNRVVMGSIIPPVLGDNSIGNNPGGSDNPFYKSNNLSVIEVPCGSEDAYKTADKWSDFSDLIEGDC